MVVDGSLLAECQLGCPENYLFSLDNKKKSGSKFPKHNLFNFENGSPGGGTAPGAGAMEGLTHTVLAAAL